MQIRCWRRPALLPRIDDSVCAGGHGGAGQCPHAGRMDAPSCPLRSSETSSPSQPSSRRLADASCCHPSEKEAVGFGVVAAAGHQGQGYNGSKIRALCTPWPPSAACLIRNAAWTTISPFFQDATTRVRVFCGRPRAVRSMPAGWHSVCWCCWRWVAQDRRWRKKPTAPSR